jgi:hypothetical protein
VKSNISLAHAKWSDRSSITFVLWRKKSASYGVSIFFLPDWRAFLLSVCLSVCLSVYLSVCLYVCCMLWYGTAVQYIQLHSVCSCDSLPIFKKKIEVFVYLRENAFLRNTNCGCNALIPNAPRDICETCMCIYAVSCTTHSVALRWNRTLYPHLQHLRDGRLNV